jgi:hypothetical protein
MDKLELGSNDVLFPGSFQKKSKDVSVTYAVAYHGLEDLKERLGLDSSLKCYPNLFQAGHYLHFQSPHTPPLIGMILFQGPCCNLCVCFQGCVHKLRYTVCPLPFPPPQFLRRFVTLICRLLAGLSVADCCKDIQGSICNSLFLFTGVACRFLVCTFVIVCLFSKFRSVIFIVLVK